MTLQETTFHSGISSKTLSSSSMLPHLAYMSTRALPIEMFDAYLVFHMQAWTCFPLFSEVKIAHAKNLLLA